MRGRKNFLHTFEYRKRDLQFLLSAIYKCYLEILKTENLVSHKENEIRDIFVSDKYLDNFTFKKTLSITEFKFDKEISTLTGRADIRILNMIEEMSGIAKPYYFIECKVLNDSIPSNASSNLYNKYVTEGINRFTDEKYLTYNEANGVIGFFIKPANIVEKCKFFTELKHFGFIENCYTSFKSEHRTLSQKNIILYHLMLDFSSIIYPFNNYR